MAGKDSEGPPRGRTRWLLSGSSHASSCVFGFGISLSSLINKAVKLGQNLHEKTKAYLGATGSNHSDSI